MGAVQRWQRLMAAACKRGGAVRAPTWGRPGGLVVPTGLGWVGQWAHPAPSWCWPTAFPGAHHNPLGPALLKYFCKTSRGNTIVWLNHTTGNTMFWARRPAQHEREVVGAATAARGVHAPSLPEAPRARGALVQSCRGRACRGSLHLLSVAVEVVGLVADNHHKQDRRTGQHSARWDAAGTADAALHGGTSAFKTHWKSQTLN